MRRITTFVTGMIVGGLLLWGALHYHILNTKTGLRFIPKSSATLSKTYVDIRKFTVTDWANHADLAIAITNADQHDLIETAAGDALQNGLDRLLNRGQQR